MILIYRAKIWDRSNVTAHPHLSSAVNFSVGAVACACELHGAVNLQLHHHELPLSAFVLLFVLPSRTQETPSAVTYIKATKVIQELDRHCACFHTTVLKKHMTQSLYQTSVSDIHRLPLHLFNTKGASAFQTSCYKPNGPIIHPLPRCAAKQD